MEVDQELVVLVVAQVKGNFHFNLPARESRPPSRVHPIRNNYLTTLFSTLPSE